VHHVFFRCTDPVRLVVTLLYNLAQYRMTRGPGSSVGIATDYGDRIPVGATFFAHVETGPGAHPASCTMGTGSFPGVKQLGRGADHTPPSSAKVENEYSYTSAPPLGSLWPVIGWPLPLQNDPSPSLCNGAKRCIIHSFLNPVDILYCLLFCCLSVIHVT
jgi:hypothetical protein